MFGVSVWTNAAAVGFSAVLHRPFVLDTRPRTDAIG
jgi:hypothetical protein